MASICKNDAGGDETSILNRVFMSFVKIQINCVQRKDTTFEFDQLISVSKNKYSILFPENRTIKLVLVFHH